MASLPLPFIDALTKGALLIGVAAVLTRLLRNQSAAARHAVWTAALLAQLALPALSLALPGWELPVLPAPREQSPPSPAPGLAARGGAGVATPSAAGTIAESNAPSAHGAALHLPSAGTLVFGIWLVGFVAVLGRLSLGTAAVRRLAQRARRVDDGDWLALTQRTATALGIGRPVTLLRGDRLPVPVTWGTVYPRVLLPRDADGWSAERRRLVLVHELAHVKRYDALTQLLAQITLAVFWMNPLVWLAVHRMSVEREYACDDYVLRDGTVASTYAQELVEMVRVLGSARSPAFAALALARRSDFERRVLAILSPDLPRRAMARGAAATMGVLAVLFVVPIAALRPVARNAPPTRRPGSRDVASVAATATGAGSGSASAVPLLAVPLLVATAVAPVDRLQRPVPSAPPVRGHRSTAQALELPSNKRMTDPALALEQSEISADPCGHDLQVEIRSSTSHITVSGRPGMPRSNTTCRITLRFGRGELAELPRPPQQAPLVVLDLSQTRQANGAPPDVASSGDRVVTRPQQDAVQGTPVELTTQVQMLAELVRTPAFVALLRAVATADSTREAVGRVLIQQLLQDQAALHSTPPAGNRLRTSPS